jgi:hypothetical protein
LLLFLQKKKAFLLIFPKVDTSKNPGFRAGQISDALRQVG